MQDLNAGKTLMDAEIRLLGAEMTQSMAMGQVADTQIREIASLYPYASDWFHFEAAFLHRAGALQDASRYLETAIMLDPSKERRWALAATILTEEGSEEDANCLARFVSLLPTASA